MHPHCDSGPARQGHSGHPLNRASVSRKPIQKISILGLKTSGFRQNGLLRQDAKTAVVAGLKTAECDDFAIHADRLAPTLSIRACYKEMLPAWQRQLWGEDYFLFRKLHSQVAATT